MKPVPLYIKNRVCLTQDNQSVGSCDGERRCVAPTVPELTGE